MFSRIACAILALSWVFPVHAQTERLSNGRFNTDLSGWQLESGAFSSWSSTDADSNPTSGSVILSRTTASSGSGFELGLSQCLSWSERRGVNVRARILLPGGSDAQAALVVIPYASPDCSGPVLAGSLVRAYTTPRDVWIRASTFFNWLLSARSLKFALAMRNPSGPASVRFDEVSLRDTAQVGHHLSGTWYNAAWNGQGFVLDLANPQDSTAAAPFFGGWYTWSEAMPVSATGGRSKARWMPMPSCSRCTRHAMAVTSIRRRSTTRRSVRARSFSLAARRQVYSPL